MFPPDNMYVDMYIYLFMERARDSSIPLHQLWKRLGNPSRRVSGPRSKEVAVQVILVLVLVRLVLCKWTKGLLVVTAHTSFRARTEIWV